MNRKISYVITLAVALVSFQLTVSAQAATTVLQDDATTEVDPDDLDTGHDAESEFVESARPETEEGSVVVVEAPESDYDKGDIAWMLVSIALVLMMTCPGLALFYGGLVRKKNILSVMMQCVFLMGLMSVVWAVIGFSLAFGGESPYFGNFDHL
ncbi:MAG: ammonium transporter, partial [Fuerstiella sp.]|nr:ammonium transporter [Fuerstiella sp.]